MADTVGYDNEWSKWADKEFELTIPLDLTLYSGFGLHLVYSGRQKADPIAKYSLNAETGYLEKLVIKSTTATESVVTMYGQRATSGLFEVGKRIDCIFFLQVTDANYDTNKQPFGDPSEFCTSAKGTLTELPDIS